MFGKRAAIVLGAVGVFAVTAAAPASASSTWVNWSGTISGCYGEQRIIEGYNGSSHEYQYGAVFSNNGDQCGVSIRQFINGNWGAYNESFTGDRTSVTTPIWYDGPTYQDQICIWDVTTNAHGMCSPRY